jgi:PAS domain S-box-containing protein
MRYTTMLYPLISFQVQLAVVAMGIILLYGYRYILGRAPLYITVCFYFIFALMADTPRLCAEQTLNLHHCPGSGALWLPFLLLMLLMYASEGIAAAQRFFLELIFTALCFFCLLFLAIGFIGIRGPVPDFIRDIISLDPNWMLRRHQVSGIIGLLPHLGFLLIMPTIYQMARNRRFWRWSSIFLCLAIYLLLNECLSAIFTATMAGVRAYVPLDPGYWCLNLSTALWISLLGHCFLNITPDQNYQRRGSNPFRFITEFVTFLPTTSRMNRSLTEWAERYKVVVENSSELILLTAPDGQIINANRMAVKCIGRNKIRNSNFTLDQVIFDSKDKPWNWKEAMPEQETDDLGPVRKVYHYHDLVLKAAGGHNIDLDLNVSHATYNGRNIAVIIAHDVTAQREEARQREEQTEQMMHSQRLEAIGQLAGGIAHDFNNLMQSIQASVDALLFKYRFEGDSRHLLANIEDGCRRATMLTTQLLGFARKGKFHTEEIDLKQLLEHIMQLFMPSAKGINCRLLCAPVELLVNCDEVQLGQVILNMLLNSRDALEGRPEPRNITIRAEEVQNNSAEWKERPDHHALAADYLCIKVRDNGCGMDQETRERMFDPFFTTKPAGRGTGMGMAMAFGCIANHHGWIHVTSEVGNGSTITIFLPKAAENAKAPQEPVTTDFEDTSTQPSA